MGELILKDVTSTSHTRVPTSAFCITLNMNESHSGCYSIQVFSVRLTLWTRLFPVTRTCLFLVTHKLWAKRYLTVEHKAWSISKRRLSTFHVIECSSTIVFMVTGRNGYRFSVSNT